MPLPGLEDQTVAPDGPAMESDCSDTPVSSVTAHATDSGRAARVMPAVGAENATLGATATRTMA